MFRCTLTDSLYFRNLFNLFYRRSLSKIGFYPQNILSNYALCNAAGTTSYRRIFRFMDSLLESGFVI